MSFDGPPPPAPSLLRNNSACITVRLSCSDGSSFEAPFGATDSVADVKAAVHAQKNWSAACVDLMFQERVLGNDERIVDVCGDTAHPEVGVRIATAQLQRSVTVGCTVFLVHRTADATSALAGDQAPLEFPVRTLMSEVRARIIAQLQIASGAPLHLFHNGAELLQSDDDKEMENVIGQHATIEYST